MQKLRYFFRNSLSKAPLCLFQNEIQQSACLELENKFFNQDYPSYCNYIDMHDLYYTFTDVYADGICCKELCTQNSPRQGNLMRPRNWGCDLCSRTAMKQLELVICEVRHTCSKRSFNPLRLRSNLMYICSDLMKCILP